MTIWRTGYDHDTRTRMREPVSRFIVGSAGITAILIGRVPVSVPVLDPATGQQVTLQSDPVRWADLLPGAYRSGDLSVAVDDLLDCGC